LLMKTGRLFWPHDPLYPTLPSPQVHSKDCLRLRKAGVLMSSFWRRLLKNGTYFHSILLSYIDFLPHANISRDRYYLFIAKCVRYSNNLNLFFTKSVISRADIIRTESCQKRFIILR